MIIGRDQGDEELDRILKTLAVNECCTLVFTVSVQVVNISVKNVFVF
jgi:hypothetical protein